MTERNRDQHNAPNNAPNVGDLEDTQDSDINMLTEEEQERGQTGWQAEDSRQSPTNDVPSNAPHVGDLEADAGDIEDMVEGAADAIESMEAKEMRRGGFRTPGDDLAPGVDVGENAPKDDNMNKRKPAGNRGQSDWN